MLYEVAIHNGRNESLYWTWSANHIFSCKVGGIHASIKQDSGIKSEKFMSMKGEILVSQAAQNRIASRSVLAIRGINAQEGSGQEGCAFCVIEIETPEHLLLQCQYSHGRCGLSKIQN